MAENSNPIDLVFDAEYRDLRDSVAEKYFGGNGKMRDACLFALSIGIRYNQRIRKDQWSDKKPISWTDLDRLKVQVGDFNVLFDYMDVNKEGFSTKEMIDEFVTGGLHFIKLNSLDQDGNFCELP